MVGNPELGRGSGPPEHQDGGATFTTGRDNDKAAAADRFHDDQGGAEGESIADRFLSSEQQKLKAPSERQQQTEQQPRITRGRSRTDAGSTSVDLGALGGALPIPVPVQGPVDNWLLSTDYFASSFGPVNANTATTATTTPTAAGHDHVPQFVAPSSYLRPRHRLSNRSAMAHTKSKPLSPLDKEQLQGLASAHTFTRPPARDASAGLVVPHARGLIYVRTCYDVLPLSFRLIVLDTDLLIKESINILTQNSIVSAPLWDSRSGRFAGILTSTDFINVIQYYCQFPDEMSKLDQFRLSSLRDIEKAIGAIPIETVSVHPNKPLYGACRRMLKTRARRIPLVDFDSETGKETVLSVITQYRILKFIAVNNENNTILLKKTLRDIGLGTYTNLATARMSSSVLDVVHMMVEKNISCAPILDREDRVLNVFEAVDVIPCIKGGVYDDLDGSVGEALCKRPDESPGIYTCSAEDRLDSIFDTIRKSRVHRLVVVDDENRLKGIISISDILKYVLLPGVEDTLASIYS
ncbi:hypothetical protein B0T10DRAFT_466968 [Thelonectria olida]|uniref:CBS domain-containing protein n=1 Tax=Thelonectria olida TaxID=1576542 RepID=A0A9P8VNS4_9HYPO|nr:hypothetical protein B0T10DRAFT_466968 [Thelonectria olida]